MSTVYLKTPRAASKDCEYCGRLYRVPRSRLAASKYCSYECMGKANSRNVRSKSCAVCGELFEQRRGEMPARFEARNYCSRVCAGVAKRKVILPEKPCEVCGELFSQGAQRLNVFLKRKYCSIKCASVSQQNEILDVLKLVKPDPVSGCHIWTGRKDWKGYGRTSLKGQPMQAHRAVWEHYKGPVPEGLHLDHMCRNTSCCNVDHLRAVTPKVNVLAGIGLAAQYSQRENCDKCGGPFSRHSDGMRYCKPCRDAKVAEYQRWRRENIKAGGDGVKHAVILKHKKRKEAEQRRTENTKACLECGVTFTAAYGQWTAFEQRKYCSPECARKHSGDHRNGANCPKCDTPYSTYPSGKRFCRPCRNKTSRLRRHKGVTSCQLTLTEPSQT